MNKKLLLLGAAICVAIATRADAALIVTANTNPSLNGSGTFVLGNRIQIGGSSITINVLGVQDTGTNGLVANTSVGIWTTTGTLLGSVTVPSGTGTAIYGDYRYIRLTTPITLTNATQYDIGAESATNGTKENGGDGFPGSIYSGGTGVTVVDSRFIAGGLARPNTVGGTGATVGRWGHGSGAFIDRANASFASGSNLTTTTVDFGNLLVGATAANQTYSIFNRVANLTADATVDLKLTSAPTVSGDAHLSTTTSTFTALAAGVGSASYTASLNTATYTSIGAGSKTVTFGPNTLIDDTPLDTDTNNNGTLTATLQANVGNATADRSGTGSFTGTSLTSGTAITVLDGLASKVRTDVTTGGTGGLAPIGTEATILKGTLGSAAVVSMTWRTRDVDEGPAGSSPPLPFGPSAGLASDVVDLNGVGSNLYVLQMDYDPSLLAVSDNVLLSAKSLYLGSFDTGTNKWENAVFDNTGNNATLAQQGYDGSFSTFQTAHGTTLSSYIGAWGVDTSTNKAWAVLNHNSEFAVVPEPGTFAMMLFGGVFLWFMGRKRG